MSKDTRSSNIRLKAKLAAIDSEDFKEWFGGSKVVSSDGSPRVMYHGGSVDFKGDQMFFTSRESDATRYGEVTEFYLSFKNPKIIDYYEEEDNEIASGLVSAEAREEGYDSLIALNTDDGYAIMDQYVAFSPDQVRLAVNSLVGDYNEENKESGSKASEEKVMVKNLKAEQGSFFTEESLRAIARESVEDVGVYIRSISVPQEAAQQASAVLETAGVTPEQEWDEDGQHFYTLIGKQAFDTANKALSNEGILLTTASLEGHSRLAAKMALASTGHPDYRALHWVVDGSNVSEADFKVVSSLLKENGVEASDLQIKRVLASRVFCGNLYKASDLVIEAVKACAEDEVDAGLESGSGNADVKAESPDSSPYQSKTSSKTSSPGLECSPSQDSMGGTQICPDGCKWDGTDDKCVPAAKKIAAKKTAGFDEWFEENVESDDLYQAYEEYQYDVAGLVDMGAIKPFKEYAQGVYNDLIDRGVIQGSKKTAGSRFKQAGRSPFDVGDSIIAINNLDKYPTHSMTITDTADDAVMVDSEGVGSIHEDNWHRFVVVLERNGDSVTIKDNMGKVRTETIRAVMAFASKKTAAVEGPHIKVTYENWTPEDIEIGDTDDKGWIDDEGISMTPEEWADEGATPVTEAVDYLKDQFAFQPSNSEGGPGTYYTNDDYNEDFQTGAKESRSYHLYNFTPEQEQQIYEGVMGAVNGSVKVSDAATRRLARKIAAMETNAGLTDILKGLAQKVGLPTSKEEAFLKLKELVEEDPNVLQQAVEVQSQVATAGIKTAGIMDLFRTAQKPVMALALMAIIMGTAVTSINAGELSQAVQQSGDATEFVDTFDSWGESEGVEEAPDSEPDTFDSFGEGQESEGTGWGTDGNMYRLDAQGNPMYQIDPDTGERVTTQGKVSGSRVKAVSDQRTFQTYKAWKAAVKKLDGEAQFTGDEDIDGAFKKGQYDAEWDGASGTIEKTAKAMKKSAGTIPVSWPGVTAVGVDPRGMYWVAENGLTNQYSDEMIFLDRLKNTANVPGQMAEELYQKLLDMKSAGTQTKQAMGKEPNRLAEAVVDILGASNPIPELERGAKVQEVADFIEVGGFENQTPEAIADSFDTNVSYAARRLSNKSFVTRADRARDELNASLGIPTTAQDTPQETGEVEKDLQKHFGPWPDEKAWDIKEEPVITLKAAPSWTGKSILLTADPGTMRYETYETLNSGHRHQDIGVSSSSYDYKEGVAQFSANSQEDIDKWIQHYSEQDVPEIRVEGSKKTAARPRHAPKWMDAYTDEQIETELPVQIVTDKAQTEETFSNLQEAKAKYPDLDPYNNAGSFTWAMPGTVDGQEALRFEDWGSDNVLSASVEDVDNKNVVNVENTENVKNVESVKNATKQDFQRGDSVYYLFGEGSRCQKVEATVLSPMPPASSNESPGYRIRLMSSASKDIVVAESHELQKTLKKFFS